MMASRAHNFSGQVQMPVNLVSFYMPPVPISSSILASLGHAHRNVMAAGMIPTNIPSFEPPWGPSIHYSQGLISLPVS